MRPLRLLPTAFLLFGCGSSGSLGSSSRGSSDPLDRYVGQACVVRGRPDVLGGVRENPVSLDYGLTPDVTTVAKGTLAQVDGEWLTIRREDGTTVLIDRGIVATLTFAGSETPMPSDRRP